MKIEFDKLLDYSLWRELSPILHIEDKSFLKNHYPISIKKDILEDCYSRLLEEGYFQIDPVDWDLPISEMAQAVKKIVEMGYPPVFSYIYDEFFLVSYKLSNLLSHILGDKFKQLPSFWAWYLNPMKLEKGWDMHRDRDINTLAKDKKPKTVSVWIPLTDVTPLNGCMYVVPAQHDPYFTNPKNNNDEFDNHHARPLSAKAGSILCWNQALLHWGGQSSKDAPNPRISIGLEFQRGDVTPYNKPLLPVSRLPDLKFRTRLIGKQMIQYRHMYPIPDEVANIAHKMEEPSFLSKIFLLKSFV